MAKLIYSAIASLDGYVEDEQGNFAWAEPDEEVLEFVSELERPIGKRRFPSGVVHLHYRMFPAYGPPAVHS